MVTTRIVIVVVERDMFYGSNFIKSNYLEKWRTYFIMEVPIFFQIPDWTDGMADEETKKGITWWPNKL